LESYQQFNAETMEKIRTLNISLRIQWKILREKVGKKATTLKNHDSVHTGERISYWGNIELLCVRSEEHLHHQVVKVGYQNSNKKNVIEQLVEKVI